MGVAGGMIGAYAKTRDPFWMMSGALCGIISVAAGMDMYYPGLTFALAFVGGVVGPIAAKFLEGLGIDDAVGAVSVHGVCGILGVVFVGIFLGSYPPFSEDIPTITFMGQFKGMIVMVLIGFIPGYALAWVLKAMGILRASDGVQEVGMDVEIENMAYPEQIKSDS
jgi:ammonia channel protein AmtB